MKLGIQHKLSIALVLISILVASAMFVGVQWSFRQGFLHYINNLNVKTLETVTQQVQEEYSNDQDWRRLGRRRHLWRDILSEQGASSNHDNLRHPPGSPPPRRSRQEPRHQDDSSQRHPSDRPSNFNPEHISERRPGSGPDHEQRGFRGGHPEPKFNDERPPRRSFDQNDGRRPPPQDGGRRNTNIPIVLLDANKRFIHGHKEPLKNFLLRTIIDDKNHILGYTGLKKMTQLSGPSDKLFVQEQTRVFTLLTIGAVLLSIVLAWPTAKILVSPVKRIARAMNKLTKRQYETKVHIHSNDELGRLADNFNIMAKTLGEYDDSQRQWMADIAHELRTPLAVLRGEIEAMQDGIRPLDQKSLGSLNQEAHHLQHLVNDLHQLALSDLGALRYEFIAIDMVEFMDDLLTTAQLKFKQSGISHEIIVKGSQLPISGDERRLQQLFQNLMQNSFRYTNAPGKVLVTLNYLANDASNYMLEVSWEDSAPGVSTENLDKLFDRLFREEKSRGRARGGSGLGLAICKNIVEAHNGSVTTEHSTLGGLKIVITLPTQ